MLAIPPGPHLGGCNCDCRRANFEWSRREPGDARAAESAFTSARAEMAKLVDEQPDYAAALSVLGMSEAGLGNRHDALAHGRRAVELFPITKDAMAGAEILRNLAITYAWVGEKELAINQLKEVVGIPSPVSYGQIESAPMVGSAPRRPTFRETCSGGAEPGHSQVVRPASS